jgi:hypothetical protein
LEARVISDARGEAEWVWQARLLGGWFAAGIALSAGLFVIGELSHGPAALPPLLVAWLPCSVSNGLTAAQRLHAAMGVCCFGCDTHDPFVLIDPGAAIDFCLHV